jgi:hypothetical protein
MLDVVRHIGPASLSLEPTESDRSMPQVVHDFLWTMVERKGVSLKITKVKMAVQATLREFAVKVSLEDKARLNVEETPEDQDLRLEGPRYIEDGGLWKDSRIWSQKDQIQATEESTR